MGKSDKKEKHTHKKSKSREVKKDKKSKSGDVKKHKSKKHSHHDKSSSKDPHTPTSGLMDQQQQSASANNTFKRSIAASAEPPSPKKVKLTTSANSKVVIPGKQYNSDSDSDSTDDDIKRSAINKAVPSPPPAVATAKQSTPVKKYTSASDSTDDNDTKQPVIKAKPKKKAAPAKRYSSDSDSDDTDNDIRRTKASTKPAPTVTKATPKNKPTSTVKSTPAKQYSSDSDSDDTDNDIRRTKASTKPAPAVTKATPKNKPTSTVKSTPAKQYSSDSDSDDTDNDTRRSKAPTKPAPAVTKATPKNKPTSTVKSTPAKQYSSDSDSDDTDNDTRRSKASTKSTPAVTKSTSTVKSTPAKHYSSDSDGSDSDTAENKRPHRSNPENVALALVDGSTPTNAPAPIGRQPTALERLHIQRKSDPALGDYSSNRLQRMRMYRNRDRDAKEEYARRFVDAADKYDVHQNFFISDSESDSDSGDDYSGEPLPWHAYAYNTEGLRKKVNEEGWKLKSGRITREEDIRLEKRIKKICRRKDMTMEDFRDMLDEDFSVNKAFWLMIAKVIPDRPMAIILRACRRRYNEHSYSKDPWTSEMDRQLLEYMKIDGKDFKLIEQKMRRSRMEIRTRAAELLQPEKTRICKTIEFTEEEFQNLTEKVSIYKGKVPWPKVTAAYNSAHPGNTRMLYQLQYAWRTRNRNKEFTVTTKLALIRAMQKYGWTKETEIVMSTLSDDFGYDMPVLKNFFLKSRTTIPDFEKKNLSATMIGGYLLFASTLLLGSVVSGQAQNAQSCVNSYDQNTDYFPQKFDTSKDSAQLFTIEYHNNYKVLTDTTNNNQKYVLVQCGTPAPAISGFPNGTEVYQIPITNAAVLSTTVVPYLEVLGVAQTTKFVSGGDWITSGCFQKYLASSTAPSEISVTNTTLATQQLSQVQVQFGYSPGAADPVANTSVASAESFENTVLGRSSWLGYYAAFYNLESLATTVLQQMTTNYDNLRKAASGYKTKPVVAWTIYDAPDQYNGNTATWKIKTGGYREQLTTDAGATIYTGSALNFTKAEDLLAAIKNVDILIDETYIATNLTDVLSNYQIKDVTQHKFAKAIYREDGLLTKSGGYDWFGTPLAMADALLEDMINVVNPSAPTSSYKRTWFRSVTNNDAIHYVSTDDCTWDETKPRPSLAVEFNGNAFTEPSSTGASSAAAPSLASAGIVTLLASTLVAVILL